jgi:hypothetical protein
VSRDELELRAAQLKLADAERERDNHRDMLLRTLVVAERLAELAWSQQTELIRREEAAPCAPGSPPVSPS